MEAKDLRIGNYVFDIDGDILKIGEILDIGVKFKNTSLSSRYNKLKPIPITEEMLLKCGYFKIDNNGVIHFYIKGHSIWLCNEMFLCEKNGIIIKYLHQLQNLYFALTNEELTINL